MDFDAIKKAAQAYGPAMTAFLRDLIAIPSESCEEEGVIKRIDIIYKNIKLEDNTIIDINDIIDIDF